MWEFGVWVREWLEMLVVCGECWNEFVYVWLVGGNGVLWLIVYCCRVLCLLLLDWFECVYFFIGVLF